jgi:methylated-DNA-protein-cysteine methyltransferase related protein
VSRHLAFYAAAQDVPVGRVATYGQIAEAAGFPRCARQVGQALSALPSDTPVPWHRIVNAKGEISLRENAPTQRRLLEAEGVVFDARGRIDLGRFSWLADEDGA